MLFRQLIFMFFWCTLTLLPVFLSGCSDSGSGRPETTTSTTAPVVEPESESEAHALTLTSPVRIALAPSGQLVVSEFNAGKVLFLNQETLAIEGSIDSSQRLAAVGAASDKILVGAEIAGAVGVYSYSGQLLYMLGSGVGEFELPNDLLVDEAGGRVYVVDTGAKMVKVYNLSDGVFLGSFGDGSMNFPTGIALDPSNDTLLISDFGVGKAGGGMMSFDPESFYAGIWRYDLGGNYLETITGSFSRPQGLAVNGDGVIFLADSLLSEVLVLQKDPGGAGYVQLFSYGGGDVLLRLPLDVVIDPSTQSLYVTNNLLDRIEVIPGGGMLP